MTMQVLLVDDDPGVLLSVRRALEFEGYDVITAADGEEALAVVDRGQPDALVLDVTMPRVDGLQVCRHLRAAGDLTPILVLTARHLVSDRVAGLDAGADDYLVKPFALDELLARLRALRRRHLDTARRLPLTGGSLDLDTRQVAVDGREPIRLSARECTLLATLAARPARVFSRDDLRMLVFDDAGIEVVETYVHYLRRKLGRGVIDTVRGRGYQLGSLR